MTLSKHRRTPDWEWTQATGPTNVSLKTRWFSTELIYSDSDEDRDSSRGRGGMKWWRELCMSHWNIFILLCEVGIFFFNQNQRWYGKTNQDCVGGFYLVYVEFGWSGFYNDNVKERNLIQGGVWLYFSGKGKQQNRCKNIYFLIILWVYFVDLKDQAAKSHRFLQYEELRDRTGRG